MITREEQKAEAVYRMSKLGLKREFIDGLEQEYYEVMIFWNKWLNDTVPQLIGGDEEDVIASFEKETGSFVWAVVENYENYAGMEEKVIYLLSVSNNRDNWASERKALLEMNPETFYAIRIMDDGQCAKSGYCETRINVTEGVIYGDI